MTLIRREDAIEAVCNAQCELDVPHYPQCDQVKYCDEIKALLALPSAETHEIRTETHECVSETHDLISRERTLRAINGYLESIPYIRNTLADMGRRDATMHCLYIIRELPSAEAEWVPFKKRPLTDEEKQEYPDWTYIFDCPLPDDEEEILLSNGKYVWTDTFINDGECYLDGGDDINDGMAWMPLPKPYKGDDDE